MDGAVANEIQEIRRRLEEIDDEREHLSAEETVLWEELLDEEHRLETRLGELEDRVVEGEVGEAEEEAAAQTDLTRTPRVPESKSHEDTGPDEGDEG